MLWLILNGTTESMDQGVLMWIVSQHSSELTDLFTAITKLGSMGTIIPLVSVLSLYILIIRNKTYASYIVPWWISIISAQSTMFLIKYIVGRARPVDALISEAGKSFPSGHATFAVACYGFMLAVLLTNRIKTKKTYIAIALLCVTILVIGFSRLYLGVHYPSDVLAGYAVGSIGVLLGMFALDSNTALEPKH